jgi:pimeloyl-ACP methyl ester carboxylesterase
MAVMYPEKIGGLISVAGAFDPEHERVRRASYPMDWKLLRWLIAPGLRVTNREKLTHVRELEILEKELSLITQPLTIMHGDEDWIVPVENAYYIEQHATNAQLDIRIQPERNHFLPFDRTWTIEQAVDDMMTTL